MTCRVPSSSHLLSAVSLLYMPPLPITFYYPYPEDLGNLDAIDLKDWRFWSASWLSRRRGWLLRTYLQLREAGHPVRISAEVPREGIVILGPELTIRRRFLATP